MNVVNVLDPRYLALIRNGTPMYVGGSGSALPGGVEMPLFIESGAAVIVRE